MTTKKNTDAATNAKQVSITLEQPIKREGGDITELTLRKPNSGELRGLSLFDLLQMDVNALCKLAPRIAQPTVTEADLHQLVPGDLVQLATEVSGFLLPKSAREEASPSV